MIFAFHLVIVLCCLSTSQVLAGRKLKWDPNTYSQLTANDTLMYAYSAYCSVESLRSWSCKWCQYVPKFELDQLIEVHDLQAFTGYDPINEQVVVSFRGTFNYENWLHDLNPLLIEFPGVPGSLVDKGFYNGWQELKPVVMVSVDKLISAHSEAQVMVTGHSLGAALAQLAALDIFNYSTQIGSTGYRFVETYGSPRWCNEVMANYFDALVDVHWRVVNRYDVVPTLPPKDRFYHHTPTMVWYVNDTSLTYNICDESGEDPKCKYFGHSVYDHLHYMGLLEGCT